jgi:hypothetical protein
MKMGPLMEWQYPGGNPVPKFRDRERGRISFESANLIGSPQDDVKR